MNNQGVNKKDDNLDGKTAILYHKMCSTKTFCFSYFWDTEYLGHILRLGPLYYINLIPREFFKRMTKKTRFKGFFYTYTYTYT